MVAADYPFLDLMWTMLIFFLWIAWFMILFRVIGDLFRRHDLSGVSKTIWLIFVILLPFLGKLRVPDHAGRPHGSTRHEASPGGAGRVRRLREVGGRQRWRSSRDRAGQGAPRQRRDHAGRVRLAEGESAELVGQQAGIRECGFPPPDYRDGISCAGRRRAVQVARRVEARTGSCVYSSPTSVTAKPASRRDDRISGPRGSTGGVARRRGRRHGIA